MQPTQVVLNKILAIDCEGYKGLSWNSWQNATEPQRNKKCLKAKKFLSLPLTVVFAAG